MLTGTLFRVAGLSSGYQRVDDYVVARQIAQNYQGDWRPDFVYYYPNFFDYLVAVFLRLVNALFRLVGVQRGPELFPFTIDQILFAARLFSALLGSATILVVYAIGRRLYSEREGLTAAFLYSVAYIPILFSHQIALDVPMTFFFALSLYFCVLIAQRRRWSDYLLAGFLGGLAVATKYNGIFIFAAVFLSHLLTQPGAKKKAFRALLDRNLHLAAGAGIAGFFAGHPYALLKFKNFLGGTKLLLQGVHETEWFLRPIQPKTWLEHIAYNKQVLAVKNILTGEGPVFLALILLGVAAVCLRRNRKTAWLALSGLAYFIGAISYLGFSRHRDLPAFAIFYAFLGMSGIALILEWGGRSKTARRAAGLHRGRRRRRPRIRRLDEILLPLGGRHDRDRRKVDPAERPRDEHHREGMVHPSPARARAPLRDVFPGLYFFAGLRALLPVRLSHHVERRLRAFFQEREILSGASPPLPEPGGG